jgi:hypothetical protein
MLLQQLTLEVPNPIWQRTAKFAERPKKPNEWYRVKIGTLNVPVAPVIGTAPLKFTPPL